MKTCPITPSLFSLALCMGLSLTAASTAPAAMLKTIDFQEVTMEDATYGTSYLTPQGFLFQNYDPVGQPTDVRIWNPNAYYSTATSSEAIINSDFNGTTLMTENASDPFSVISLDISSSFPRTVSFIGTKLDGSIVSQSITTPGNGYQNTSIVFTGFDNLVSFDWGQHSNSVDNIVVSVAPEPTAAVLLTSGVFAFATVWMLRSRFCTR